jgi:hypothetical protein
LAGWSAATLVSLNYAIGYMTFRSKRIEVIEEATRVIVHNGRVFEDVMRRAQLTHHELARRSASRAAAAPKSKDGDSRKQRVDQRHRPSGATTFF